MAVTPYLLLGRKDKALLLARLESIVASWRDQWCADDGTPVVLAFGGAPTMDCEWQANSIGEDARVAAATERDASLVGTFLGAGADIPNDDMTADVLADVMRIALGALCTTVLQEGGVVTPRQAPDGNIGGTDICHDAGYTFVECRLSGANLYLALSAPVVQAYLDKFVPAPKRSGGLVSRAQALAGQTTTLQVSAGGAELSLPELATLAVGDVIRLDRRVEQPALVKLGGTAVVCAGYLGTQERHKAVQLSFFREGDEA